MKRLAEVCRTETGQVYIKFLGNEQLPDLVGVTLYGHVDGPRPPADKPFAWMSQDAVRTFESHTGCVDRSACNMQFGLYNTPLFRHPAPKIHGYDVFCTIEGITHRITGYTGGTEKAVKEHVIYQARREGYKGSVEDRLRELGWRIQPIFSY